MKFQIDIKHLLEAYRTPKKHQSKFLCNFIFYNYLPKQSIKNFLFFMLCANHNNQFMDEIKQIVGRPYHEAHTLEELLHDHPDFEHTLSHNHREFRIAFLERLLELHPNLTFTLEYRII